MNEHEPGWVTESSPLSAEEMARRLLVIVNGVRHPPRVGSQNMFGEPYTEQAVRNLIKRRLERLADRARAFAEEL